MHSERWMDQKIMQDFFKSLNDYFANQNKKATVHIFGGGALCLHGLRDKTGDFDTVTLLEGNQSTSANFEEIKKYCLPTIGVYPSAPKFDNTYNDISHPIMRKEALGDFLKFLLKTQETFQFNTQLEYSHLQVIAPPKEYLLLSRLIDLQYPNPKTELDKKDCEELIKNLGINSQNKEEFLKTYSKHPKIEIITEQLNNSILVLESKNSAIHKINKMTSKKEEPLRNNQHSI